MHLCKKLLQLIGLSPDRMRLEWISASEGNRFAEVMSEFAERLRQLGPLGSEGEIDNAALILRLSAVSQLVPYLKLVEREKLRVPTKSEEAYNEFFTSDEVNALFDEVIAEKLAISQILLSLKEKPLSTGEISQALDLNPSEVSRYMNSSSRLGFVKYDVEGKRYVLA
jgi:DNA-binding transcriptional ArsR family regulator